MREPVTNLAALRQFTERMPVVLGGVPPAQVLAALRASDHPARQRVLAVFADALGGVDPGDLEVAEEIRVNKTAMFFFSDRESGARLAAVSFVDLVEADGRNGAFVRELKGFGAVAAVRRRARYDGPPLVPELLDAGVLGSPAGGDAMGMFVPRYVPGGRTLHRFIDDVVNAKGAQAKQAAFEKLCAAFRAAGRTVGTLHRISAVPLAEPRQREIPENGRVSARLEQLGRQYAELAEALGIRDLPELVARAGAVESGGVVRDHPVAVLTHGDLNPGNIVLDWDGHAWLVDLESAAGAIGADQLPGRFPPVYDDPEEYSDTRLAEGDGDPMTDVDGVVTTSYQRLAEAVDSARLSEVFANYVAGYEEAWPEVSVADRMVYLELLNTVQGVWFHAQNMSWEGPSRERVTACVEGMARIRRLLARLRPSS